VEAADYWNFRLLLLLRLGWLLLVILDLLALGCCWTLGLG